MISSAQIIRMVGNRIRPRHDFGSLTTMSHWDVSVSFFQGRAKPFPIWGNISSWKVKLKLSLFWCKYFMKSMHCFSVMCISVNLWEMSRLECCLYLFNLCKPFFQTVFWSTLISPSRNDQPWTSRAHSNERVKPSSKPLAPCSCDQCHSFLSASCEPGQVSATSSPWDLHSVTLSYSTLKAVDFFFPVKILGDSGIETAVI